MFGLNASVFDLGWIIFSAIISCVSYTLSGAFVDQDHCDETEWLPLDWKVLVIFSLLKVVLNHSKGESVCIFHSNILLSVFFFFSSSFFKHQIQNADDVLITPLEKFRKEQIGAAKVRDHLRTQLATEQQRYSTRSDTLTSRLQPVRLPHSMEVLD